MAERVTRDMIGSCEEIIDSQVVRVLIWFYAFIVLSLNLVSTGWLSSQYRQAKVEMSMVKRTSSLLSINLCVSDGLIAVYLLILAFIDTMHRGDVTFVVVDWKESTICHLLGIPLMLSIESSIASTLLIAFDRLVCLVLKPFRKYGLTFRSAIKGLFIVWSMSVVLPIVTAIDNRNQISNSACIRIGNSIVSLYSYIYLIYNSLLFTLMISSYLVIMKTIKKRNSMINDPAHTSTAVVMKLGLIIITNFFAWLTVTLVNLIAMTRANLPKSVEAMFALITFPVNAFLNPLLYTICTKQFISSLGMDLTRKEHNQ